MKKLAVIFIIISFISCNLGKRVEKNNDMYENKILYLLKWGSFEKDFKNNDLILYSADFMLEKIINKDSIFIIFNKKEILIGNTKKFVFTFEIFDKRFLLITLNNNPCGFAGPDEVTRDNILIMDFESKESFILNLNMVYLTRSYTTLKEYYPSISEQEISKSYIKYCCIKEILTKEKKIILINQSDKLEEYILKEVDLPYTML